MTYFDNIYQMLFKKLVGYLYLALLDNINASIFGLEI
jgi:hypothetical protein